MIAGGGWLKVGGMVSGQWFMGGGFLCVPGDRGKDLLAGATERAGTRKTTRRNRQQRSGAAPKADLVGLHSEAADQKMTRAKRDA